MLPLWGESKGEEMSPHVRSASLYCLFNFSVTFRKRCLFFNLKGCQWFLIPVRTIEQSNNRTRSFLAGLSSNIGKTRNANEHLEEIFKRAYKNKLITNAVNWDWKLNCVSLRHTFQQVAVTWSWAISITNKDFINLWIYEFVRFCVFVAAR